MIVIPLPIFALVYGYFIPESPIFLSQVRTKNQSILNYVTIVVHFRRRVTLSLTRKHRAQILPKLLSMNASNSSLVPSNYLIEGMDRI